MSEIEPKQIIEALLFATDKPLSINEIKGILEDAESSDIRKLIEEISTEYKSSGKSFFIEEVAGGYKLAADPIYAPWIKKLFGGRRSSRLSGPSLETLAIVAYKQPLTKAEVERIRGVNVDGLIKNLLEKNLVKITGRKEVIGRPWLYGTTPEFMEHFGLKSLRDLPKLEEFVNLEEEKALLEEQLER